MGYINWFPGHMHKTTKALKKLSNQIDIVFEIVDTRAPRASANDELQAIFANKPIVSIFSKVDLADPDITKQWIKAHPNQLMFNLLKDKSVEKQLKQHAQRLLPARGSVLKPIRAIIIGIPNVGKSTLINQLYGKKICHTGNTPAVTQHIQAINQDRKFIVHDCPGIMLKNISSTQMGLKLAAIHCIKETAFDDQVVAEFLYDYLSQYYPLLLTRRYQIDGQQSFTDNVPKLAGLPQAQTVKAADSEKASKRLIQDFRRGLLGRISLERPEDYSQEE